MKTPLAFFYNKSVHKMILKNIKRKEMEEMKMCKATRKNISLCVAAMVLTVLFAGIPAVQAQAESSTYKDEETGLIWSYELDESVSGNAIITWCEDADGNELLGEITIPDNIAGHTVTKIGNYAFYYCSGLTSIAIPSSVTEIGVGAFSGCSGLTSIAIPSSVTEIGDCAFDGCSGLTSIAIPSGVTEFLWMQWLDKYNHPKGCY